MMGNGVGSGSRGVYVCVCLCFCSTAFVLPLSCTRHGTTMRLSLPHKDAAYRSEAKKLSLLAGAPREKKKRSPRERRKMKANVKLKRALILRAEGFFSIIIRRLYAFGGAFLLLLLLLLRGVRGLFFFSPLPIAFPFSLAVVFAHFFFFWRQSGNPAETQFWKAWQSGREAAAIFCVHNFLRGAAFCLPFLVLLFCAVRQSTVKVRPILSQVSRLVVRRRHGSAECARRAAQR